ncbi:FHA domain-containing protein [Tundrisphaera sp. TA3]|uniref:FHA domain-containing protein n=1 Tax=Tundrisphaera sp. TA3 TaxID=3435775 RepID=UPI003EBCC604
MKAQLVVVQGKPEGKTIPLAIPIFKIGRGDTCQLRPNNDLVSREHAEFQVGTDTVIVRDLGSRNGTQVNGRTLNKGESYTLKNGDLVTVGTLTFALSITGVEAKAAAQPKKPKSLDDASHDDIDSWLVSDAAGTPPDRPSGVYDGATLTLATYNGKEKEKEKEKEKPKAAPAPAPAPAAKAPASAPAPAPKAPTPPPIPEPVAEDETVADDETEAEDEIPGIDEVEEDDGIEDLSEMTASDDSEADDMPEEFIDESNPFYVAKKKAEAPAATSAAKDASRDSSDVAGDILRKMMERRRAR